MQELQYELEMPDLLTGGSGSGGSGGGRSAGGSSINNDNNTSSLDASDDSSLSTNGDDLPLAMLNHGEKRMRTFFGTVFFSFFFLFFLANHIQNCMTASILQVVFSHLRVNYEESKNYQAKAILA